MIEVFGALLGAVLYRLRGGWFEDLTKVKSTQLMRAIWSVPTGLLLSAVGGLPWWGYLALPLFVFAGLALYGHGAHMIIDAEKFVLESKNKTELLTAFWLPRVFGGIPDTTWDRGKVNLYNVSGMSFIGLIRNLTTVLPLFFFEPISAAVYTLSGLLHGPAYWLGWKVGEASATGEFFVGAISWTTILYLR